MATHICIDVDLTLVDEAGSLRREAIDGLSVLKDRGYTLILWSSCGQEYAREVARRHRLCCFFDEYATKPDLAIDDENEKVSRLPVVDASVASDWGLIAERTVRLADDLEEKGVARNAPTWLRTMWRNRFDVGVQSSIAIWQHRQVYFRWPRKDRNRILSTEWVRHRDGRKKDCYDYPPQLVTEIRQAGLPVDRRNNGPAILSFQLAGGERPKRPYPSRWGWTIHHIYDGQHSNPRFPMLSVPHAPSNPQQFTDSRGLVAVHPLADYIAMREPLMAWLLRWEAFRRFNFDPMGVFIAP